jgi:hypothetical protein
MALQGPLVVKGVLIENAYIQFFSLKSFPPHTINGSGLVFFNKEQAEISLSNSLDAVGVECDYENVVDEIGLLDRGALSDDRFADMVIVDNIVPVQPDRSEYRTKKLHATSGTGFD